MRIPFCVPDITQREIDEVAETLRSGWLTTGPRVKRFEELFREYVHAPHAVAVNSCTAALHLALTGLGLGEGDEVVTTPYTFVASSETILYHKARPVFVDIDPETLCMDPEGIERVLGPRTKVILPVHIAGYPADMDPILALANQHGLKVVEDAAHATETWYNDRKVGSIADATAFSFYATKNLAMGEGGLLTCADEQLAERVRRLSLHGMSKEAWGRYNKGGSWYYEITENGFKYNLTDLQAAIGLVQLDRIEQMRERRLSLTATLKSILGQYPGFFTLPHENGSHQHAWHLYILRLNLDALSIDRNRFIEELEEMGVSCSVHFIPLHIQPYYRKRFGYAESDFPLAHREFLRALSLPFYSAMSDEQAIYVGEACVDVAKRFCR